MMFRRGFLVSWPMGAALATLAMWAVNATSQAGDNPKPLPLAELERLFAEPGPQYRGKPFWSWNGDLKQEELVRQMHVLKEMGMGGFFMHSRTGLATEYLGPEWFRLTNACADDSVRLGMEAWLYDEDRWPSGTAGGAVTVNPKYRLHFMAMKRVPAEQFQWDDTLTAAFACRLEGASYRDCRRIRKNTPPADYRGMTVLAFAVEEMEKSPFYNGTTYVDTMNPAATREYIRLTHEQYRKHCGDRLGRSIKGIFTDEPHRGSVLSSFGKSNKLPGVPWTEALPGRFRETFGYDLVDRLPELFLKPNGQEVSQVKWHYMELTQRLFLESFAKPILDWCRQNRMVFTGHVLHEDSLTAQATMQGSMMRFYEYMDWPGVDVLTEGNRNYWIVKQLSSAARQLGQKWLLSELYGCTGWQMPFEGHKAVGDWQALFGINLRCHHLCWYTMAGEAKRDYPASIFYQSAWWKDYKFVEGYFSRLGMILTQGKPCCDVLVVSPVESVWCRIHDGWVNGLAARDPAIQQIERQYQEMFFWLTGSHIDFDYGDEEMIGRLYRVDTDATGPVLWIGKAPYRLVIVGGMSTIRSSTLKLLNEFARAGGKVIFAGPAPEYVDALSSKAGAQLAARATRVPWEGKALVAACRSSVGNLVEILDRATGQPAEEIFCQLREEGGRRSLVAMNINPGKKYADVLLRMRGPGWVSEWDCASGRRYAVRAEQREGRLEWVADFAPSGEHVYVVTPEPIAGLAEKPAFREVARVACPGPFEYRLSEPNVCVLDLAQYRIADGPQQPETEILKIDRAVRRHFDLEVRAGDMVQPWFKKKHQPKPEVKGKVALAFAFAVDHLPRGGVQLALEQPEAFRVKLNGKPVATGKPAGWWVDPAICSVPLPAGALQLGKNVLEAETDFHEQINLEAMYLLGDFGVRVAGSEKTLAPLAEKLSPGDLAKQGLPFYSGAVTYKIPVPRKPARGEHLVVDLPKFEAACAKVLSPGQGAKIIAWQPYQADVTGEVAAGGSFELQLVLTRRNTFGPLHQVPLKAGAYGPGSFTTEGRGFSQSYMLYPAGLLEAPAIVVQTQR